MPKTGVDERQICATVTTCRSKRLNKHDPRISRAKLSIQGSRTTPRRERLLRLSRRLRRLHLYLDIPFVTMAEVTLRTRKFIRNPLLGRKQMVVYVSSSFQDLRSETYSTRHAKDCGAAMSHTDSLQDHNLTHLRPQ